MTNILSTLIVAIIVILVIALGASAMIFIAYGIGWVINFLTGLQMFQATILGLAGIFVFIMFIERVFSPFLSSKFSADKFDDNDDFDDDDDFDEDEDEIDDYEILKDEETLNKLYAGIPLWRRPAKTLDFSNVAPDQRCPCGSGRKYKNCHGTKQKKA